MDRKTVVLSLVIALSATQLQGCGTLLVAGAAGAAGYLAYENGYRVQNPITKPGD